MPLTVFNMRLMLSEANFRDLVAGKAVSLMDQSGIKIELALSDIGYDRMRIAMDDAKAVQSR